MRNLLFASILLVTSSLFGADKFFSQDTGAIDLTIDGPTSATIGEFIELDAGDIPFEGKPSWVIINPPKKGGWKVYTSDREDGARKQDNIFAFSTPYPGRYGVVFSFSTVDAQGMKPDPVDKAKIKTQSILHWITVTALDEVAPDPEKPDPVKPDPKPDTADEFGLIKLSREWVSLMPEPAKSKKSDVSTVFESVAAQIAAGTIKDADESFDNISSGMKSKITNRTDLGNWSKFFMDKLSNHTEKLYDDGKLNTLDAYRKCWADVSKGLK